MNTAVPLGSVLTKSGNWIEIDPLNHYTELTVHLWGRGVSARRVVEGSEMAGQRRLKVLSGEFVVSRIDARHGAFAVIPDDLDGAVVSNDFPAFRPSPERLLPKYLGWLSRTHYFIEACRAASEGTTNRVRLKEEKFAQIEIPLPPVTEQQRIVAKIEALVAKIDQARGLHDGIEQDARTTLHSEFSRITSRAQMRPMDEVAPLVRRPTEIVMDATYPELGIRSFGHGTFHKPELTGFEVGPKKLFEINAGDLLFNIVFAWEGAVAVAQSTDRGRFGSHRFLTCVPRQGMATPKFLCFYFLSREGLEKLGHASPGGAGRNRTLGLKALERIEVPIPPIEQQHWFDGLQVKVDRLKALQAQTRAELDALLPSILDRAFKGEL